MKQADAEYHTKPRLYSILAIHSKSGGLAENTFHTRQWLSSLYVKDVDLTYTSLFGSYRLIVLLRARMMKRELAGPRGSETPVLRTGHKRRKLVRIDY